MTPSLLPLVLTLALGAAQAAPLPEGVHIGAPPQWVQSVQADVTRSPPEGAARESVQHLLVDDQSLMGPNPQRYQHGAYRIVTQEALEGMSRMEVVFAPEYSGVTLHEVQVWRDGAWHDRLEQAHVALIQQETALWQHMFDGSQTLVVVMPDIRVGDVVSYAYTIEGFNPVFAGHIMDAHWMGWSVPALRRTLRLLWPETRQVNLCLHGALPMPVETTADGLHEAVWDLADVPAYVEESDVPLDVDPYPWVQVSDFASWAELVDWALPLYAAIDAPDEELRAFAEGLVVGAATPEEQILACLRWVQDDLRYFGIEMGVRSHAPHDPHTVLERRFGDCKDKSLLLAGLLRALGFQAWPALVSNDLHGAVARWHPDPTAFDHVIVLAELEGRSLWMDPTLTQQGGGLDELWVDDYGWALPIRSGEQGLVAVPAPVHPQGLSTVEYEYRLFPGRRAPTLKVCSRFEGQRADMLRAWLADISEADLAAELLARVGTGSGVPTAVRPASVDDDRPAGVLTLEEHYRLEGGWLGGPGARQESLELIPPDLFTALPAPENNSRSQPLLLPKGLREVERLHLVVPAGWDLQRVEAHQANPWFRFDAHSSEQQDGLLIEYAVEVLADRVVPGDLPAYLQALDAFQQAGGYTLQRGPKQGMGEGASGLLSVGLGFLLGLLAGVVLGAGGVLLAMMVVGRRRSQTA